MANKLSKASKTAGLKVKVKEDVEIAEKLFNYKKWFNGMKRFASIKPSPPKN